MIGNKIADKITSTSKKKSPNNDEREEDVEITTHKRRYVSPEEWQQLTDELRLVIIDAAMYKNKIQKTSELVRQYIKSTI